MNWSIASFIIPFLIPLSDGSTIKEYVGKSVYDIQKDHPHYLIKKINGCDVPDLRMAKAPTICVELVGISIETSIIHDCYLGY